MILLLLPLAWGQAYRAPFSDAHYGYFYPTAYYDHSGVDWACGSIRYSGHRGNDFGGGSWSGMSAGRGIVAAADGTVVATHDGEFDECSSGSCGGGGGFGNYIAIRHDDGKTTYYGHLKKWTVAVSTGQRVSCGQHLGYMGSSGNSTGPHLHFEPRTSSNVAADPFDGSCSSPPSYWTSQGSHGGLPGRACETHDSDGDGWDDDEDCAPNNASVHPGAAEVCDDGVDNDCTGGDAHSETWYRDDDGDGFGAEARVVCGSPGGGWVRQSGDCDDSRASVSPSARELCDGLDNDCDGEIDDGPPTELADPLPAYAARLIDASTPSSLAPGEAAQVWFVFENVGAEPWAPRGLRLSTSGGASALADEASWPAWDVLAVLEQEVPPGQTAALMGTVRVAEDAPWTLDETFHLSVGDQPVRCPSGEARVALRVRGVDPDDALEEADGPAGCGLGLGGAGWSAILLLLWRRRR
ncbi:MAG: peptidoglycan DD-metalloendopeptidase family protein [Alphaproteobacteria bacterium]|nr:peptidoglycan DD-metalloendopeptidase family protein [Alphaproteobacteria bacterium]